MSTDICTKIETADYSLLDSGNGLRLERFANQVLVRPSSVCAWQAKLDRKFWSAAHAEFIHKSGWKYHAEPIADWECAVAGVKLLLKLQDNGQVGYFPEHQSYLAEIVSTIRSRPEVKLLNLFAYTGLASLVSLRVGAEVTHVDISKKILDWASQNIKLNNLEDAKLRFIKEDALEFVRKEIKRGHQYDIIIADPPSFSRISDKKNWSLEENLYSVLSDLAKISKADGKLFFANHLTENGGQIAANILCDLLPNARANSLKLRRLGIKELNSLRILPAGHVVIG